MCPGLESRQYAVVAEWLRRLTRNQFRSAGVGSNPTDREYFLGGAHFCLICIVWAHSEQQESIVGSVVECSPATRAARVRFPDDANSFYILVDLSTQISSEFKSLKYFLLDTFLLVLWQCLILFANSIYIILIAELLRQNLYFYFLRCFMGILCIYKFCMSR